MKNTNLDTMADPQGLNLREENTSWWGRISEWIFYFVIFLLPLWSLPYTIFPLQLNKNYLLYFLVIIAGVLYLFSVLREGKFFVSKNFLWPFLLALVLSFALSGVFSSSRHVSFLGTGVEVGTFSAILLFAAVLFFSSLIFNSERKALIGLVLISISFILLFIFQLAQSIFGIPVLSWLGNSLTANPLGSWNELGIFSGLIFLLGILFADSLPPSRLKVFFSVVAGGAFLLAALVNFNLVWWIVAFLLIVFLAYIYSRTRDAKVLFRVPFLALVLVVFFIFASSLASEIISNLGIQSLEVRPSWSSTYFVLSEVLKNNPVLGSGPNTFLYDWLLFRPADVNATPFWQVRFSTGVGLLPTFLGTAGILGGLSVLGLLLSVLWYGFRSLTKKDDDVSLVLVAILFGTLYLWIFAAIYSPGFALMFLVALFTGIFIGLATANGALPGLSVSIFERSGLGFLASLLIILFIVLGVSWFYVMAQKYYAALEYGIGVEAVSRGNFDRAEGHLERAVRLDRQDRYYRTLTDLGLIKVQQVLNRRDLSPDVVRTEFQNVLGVVVQNAQTAVNLNPADPLNWMNLGRVYEAIVPFQIQGASDFAKNSYEEALKRFPQGPEPHLASARVELLENNLPEAREFLQKALELKPDYAPANFLLAQLEARAGNINEAIRRSEATALISPNDIGVLFQLGLLYYQNDNLNASRTMLERAVSINQNYSNARYFLGLIYDRNGEKEKALEEFKRISDLNPGNEEVLRIIENLESGRSALAGISPPGPAPEDRDSPPVE